MHPVTQTITDQGTADVARCDGIRSQWLAAAVIVVLTGAAYVPAMRGGFVWDDGDHLLRNPVVQDATPARIWFSPMSAFEYYPVTWTSYWLEHRLWGMDPTGYHVVNVLLHAASTLLLWRVLRRLAIPAALTVALLFALHPVNVESVAWVTQRKNVLSMFFMVAALLAYLRFEDARRAAWYLGAAASFTLAMLSKSGVIGLPIVLLLLAWWRRGAIDRRDVWRVLPFLAVAVLATLIQQPVRDANVIGQVVVRDDGFFARLAGAGWAVWFYLYKAVLPINLSFIYPRWQIDPTNPLVYVPGAALVAVAVLCWRMRGSWGRPAMFALAVYLVMVGPALGLVDFYYLRYSFVADHYQYYAIIAVLGLIVPVVMSFLRRYKAAGIAAAVLVAGFGVLTYRQSTPYRTEQTLWRDVLRKNPDAWLAHNNLGNRLAQDGQVSDALYHYRESLRSNPDYAVAQNGLGALLLTLRRIEEATPHLQRAVELDPQMSRAHRNLGVALLELGRYEKAVARLERYLQFEPEDGYGHYCLGIALTALKDNEGALQSLERAATYMPGHQGIRQDIRSRIEDLRKSSILRGAPPGT